MDRLREEFFAGARFTEQEDRSVCGGHALRLGKHFPQGPALADDSPVVVLQSDLPAKIDVFLFEALAKLFVLGKCGPNRLVRPLAHQDVGEDLRNHLKPVHERFRPEAFLLHVMERQRADKGPSSRRERDCQGALDAEAAQDLLVAGCLARQILQGGNGNRLAGQ